MRQREKGRLVQSINNLYPVFLVEWIMERGGAGRGGAGRGGEGRGGAGRGGEGMVRRGQINRNLN